MLRKEIEQKGFTIIEDIFSKNEVLHILEEIKKLQESNLFFKQNQSVFAVRCFLKQAPHLKKLIFTSKLKNLVFSINPNFKIVKSIYFDKPPKANWVVNWHQDLTISVDKKNSIKAFKNWLPKKDYYSVQPPKQILDNILTLRLHLDNCTKANGALQVIPKSHLEIQKAGNLHQNFFENTQFCESKLGGILFMKPLLWHSSKRTQNDQNRRVIHIELSPDNLPKSLEWYEKLDI